MSNLLTRAQHKLSYRFIYRMRRYRFYPYLYPATWRAMLVRPAPQSGEPPYLTAFPHPTAGIGHQMANWIAGYLFARQFGCRYAYAPLPSKSWEVLIGFGHGEETVGQLSAAGYRKVRLPLFDEGNAAEVAHIRKIINAYTGKRVLLTLEYDQFQRAQYHASKDLRAKFTAGPARDRMRILYDPTALNIAVHVRRGDVSLEAAATNENLRLRWQDADYFEKVLSAVLQRVGTDRPMHIYVFSQGKESDFASFTHYPNVRLCLDLSAEDSFLHMVAADVLIASKSGFSYNAALLGEGVRIVPRNFWHDYPPDDPLWIFTDDDGAFDSMKLTEALPAVLTPKPAAHEPAETLR